MAGRGLGVEPFARGGEAGAGDGDLSPVVQDERRATVVLHEAARRATGHPPRPVRLDAVVGACLGDNVSEARRLGEGAAFERDMHVVFLGLDHAKLAERHGLGADQNAAFRVAGLCVRSRPMGRT